MMEVPASVASPKLVVRGGNGNAVPLQRVKGANGVNEHHTRKAAAAGARTHSASVQAAVRAPTKPHCGERAFSQREVLRDVMLSANQCGAWLTLRELSLMTRYGEASISAQLRHLRKAEFGAYAVEKRLRHGEALALRQHGAVWEYRMSPRLRVAGGKTRRNGGR